MITQKVSCMNDFWRRYPALLYGLSLLFGSFFALVSPLAFFPFLLLLLHKKKVFSVATLFLLPSVVAYQFYTFPTSGTLVDGVFYIHSIRKSERFGKGWVYQGTLHTKEGRVRCRCFAKEYLSAQKSYHIAGKIRKTHSYEYALKTHGKWIQKSARFNCIDLRYKAQEKVKAYISQCIPQKRASHFLSGIVTGQLEDKILQKEFNQLGLSHLMAISGLHFSLIAMVLHVLFRLFLPPKMESIALMCGLTLYFMFVGNTPSILRAWMMAMVFLLGLLFERRTSGINSLGVALCLAILIDPLSTLTLSFQLSFLATGGILFFYLPCEQLLQKWLPKKKFKHVIFKNVVWQWSYIGYSLLRSSFALTAAVHLVLLPLLLNVFHNFSLNSLFYNLFFPFFASMALLFFILSIPFGPWLHLLNGYFCDWILRITESPPLHLKTIYVSHFPSWLLTVLLTSFFVLGVKLNTKSQRREEGF